MKSFPILATILSVGLAGPALAQQAPAAPAAAPTAAQAAAPAAAPRTVTARELMTPQERATLRAQMRQATPEQRQALWAQNRTQMQQRAAARGQVLAEPAGRGPGMGERGERSSSWSRMFSWGARAP